MISTTRRQDFTRALGPNGSLSLTGPSGHNKRSIGEAQHPYPLLAYHFLNINAKKQGKSIRSIPEAELDNLKAYHWPGNIGELENIIERGVILSTGSVLQIPGPDVNTSPAVRIRPWRPLRRMNAPTSSVR